jgi:hypothetical protein
MSARRERPRVVVITFWLAILLSTWQAGRLFALWEQTGLLLTLRTIFDPRITMLTAAIWALIFLAIALAIWNRKSLVRWLFPFTLTLFALVDLFILRLLGRLDAEMQDVAPRLLLYGSLILFVAGSLNWSGARLYFAGQETPAHR